VAFVLGRKAALGGEVVGFAEGSEEAVPPGNVAEVEFVDVKLVMDGMVFGALDASFQGNLQTHRNRREYRCRWPNLQRNDCPLVVHPERISLFRFPSPGKSPSRPFEPTTFAPDSTLTVSAFTRLQPTRGTKTFIGTFAVETVSR
jgi:hypothetical protein